MLAFDFSSGVTWVDRLKELLAVDEFWYVVLAVFGVTTGSYTNSEGVFLVKIMWGGLVGRCLGSSGLLGEWWLVLALRLSMSASVILLLGVYLSILLWLIDSNIYRRLLKKTIFTLPFPCPLNMSFFFSFLIPLLTPSFFAINPSSVDLQLLFIWMNKWLWWN